MARQESKFVTKRDLAGRLYVKPKKVAQKSTLGGVIACVSIAGVDFGNLFQQ